MRTQTNKMASRAYLLLVLTLLFVIPSVSYSQFVIQNFSTPQQLVEEVLLGEGVSVSNVSYTGSTLSVGSFSNGNPSVLGFSAGIMLSTGKVTNLFGANSVPNMQFNTQGTGDAQLQLLTPMINLYDAAILEFDFVPTTDSIQFRFVFGSEEYAEWIGSNFNDVFGFFVSGTNPLGGNYIHQNIALIPNTSLPISTNTINNGFGNAGPCNHCNYYINNTGGSTLQLDGYTTTMIAKLLVVPCQTYHIKIALADGADHSYDSGVFLEANSFTSIGLHLDAKVFNHTSNSQQIVEGCDSAAIDFILSHPLSYNLWVPLVKQGNAVQGVDYQSLPDSILIPQGSDSVRLYIKPIFDQINEGIENIFCIVPISSCTYDTIHFQIKNYSPLSANFIGDTVYCKFDQIHLQASASGGIAPYNYQWSNGLPNNQINLLAVQDTTLVINISDACGFSSQIPQVITVKPIPFITLQNSTDSLCYNGEVHFTVTGAYHYTWYKDNQQITNYDNDSLALNLQSNTMIKVIGKNQNLCQSQKIKTIYVSPQIQLQASPSLNSVCEGDTAIFSLNGANQYQWNTSLYTHNQDFSEVSLIPTATDSFYVNAWDASGCRDSILLKVIVHPTPTLTISTLNDTLCLGSSSVLHASGGNQYWWPSQGLNQTFGNSVIATPTANTTYFVQTTNLQGCSNTDSIELTVYDKPSVGISLSTNKLCNGDTLILKANGANFYKWMNGNQVIAYNQAQINYVPNHSTTIRVIGFDLFGCSDTIGEVVAVLPEFNILLDKTTVCKGNEVHAEVVSSNTNLNYSWSNGNQNQIIDYMVNGSSTIGVTVTDQNGCTKSMAKQVNVYPASIFNVMPTTQSICKGNTSFLYATNANDFDAIFCQPNYVWHSLNSDTFKVSPNTTTQYTLIGLDSNGCYNESANSALVNVYDLPNINITPAYADIQADSTLTLTASGGLSYTWSPTVVIGLGNGTNSILVTTDTLTHLKVVGIDANGCVNSNTAVINPHPYLRISTHKQSMCVGDSTYLQAETPSSCHFFWSTGAFSQGIWVKPNTSTTYHCTIIDNTGFTNTKSIGILVYTKPYVYVSPDPVYVCQGTQTVMEAKGARFYQWFPSTELNNTIGKTVITSATQNIVYSVVGTDDFGCSDTASVDVYVIPNAQVAVSQPNISICEGQSAQMQASGTYQYLWEPSLNLNDSSLSNPTATPTNTIRYKVTGKNINGCRDTASVLVTVKSSPKLALSIMDTTYLCQGDSIQVSVNGADGYQWFPANGLNSSAINDSIVTLNPNNTTTYIIVGINQNSCTDSSHTTLGVEAYPNININPANLQICPNDSVILTAVGADNYSWLPNCYLDTNQGAQVTSLPDTSITYQIIGKTEHAGCVDTAYAFLGVSPISRIAASKLRVCAGDSTLLTAYSDNPYVNYSWSNGSTSQSTWVKPYSTQAYSLTTTQISGCQHHTSILIMVNSTPTIQVSADHHLVCPADTVLLTASGALTYTWTPGNSLSSMYGDQVNAVPAFSTLYTVEGVSMNGCSDTASIFIETRTPPQVSVSPNFVTICSGNYQELSASGALNYNWYPHTGLSSITGDTVVVIPNTNMSYMVIGNDSFGCTDTAYTHFITTGNATISPISAEICEGINISLSSISLNQPQSYLWNTGDTSQSIVVNPQITTNYSLTITYASGCSKISQRSVIVHHDSAVQVQVVNPLICLGDTAILTASAGYTYSWFGNGLISSPYLAQLEALPSSSSWYKAIASSVHGCISQDSVFVGLYNQPPIQITASATQVCAMDTIVITAQGGTNYQWLNPVISQSNNTVLAIPNQTTTYSVIGYDQHFCSDTVSMVIQTHAVPQIQISPNYPSVCPGDSVLISIIGNDNYSWGSSNYMNVINNSQASLFPNTNMFFNLSAINSFGCTKDTIIRCDVKREPIIELNLDSALLCAGDSIQLIALGALNYLWNPSPMLSNAANDSVYVKPINNTNYAVEGISSDGCSKIIYAMIEVEPIPVLSIFSSGNIACEGDSIHLMASSLSPNCNFVWNTGDSSNLLNTIGNQSKTYQVDAISPNACIGKDSVTINIYARPQISLNQLNPTICAGDTLILKVNADSLLNLNWNIGYSGNTATIQPNYSQIISIIATDSNGCLDTALSNISVIPLPNIQLTASTTVCCINDSVAIQAQTTNPNLQLVWSNGNVSNSISINPTNTNYYSITATDTFGCINADSILISVNPAPQITIVPTANAICKGDSTNLSIVSNNNNLSYAWGVGNTVSQISVSPLVTSYFDVTVTDSIGCATHDSIELTVYNLPTVNFISPVRICLGDTIILEPYISGSISQFAWSNGSTSSSINIHPSINTPYSLTVTDTNQCSNSDDIIVEVATLPIITIIANDSIFCSGEPIYLQANSNHSLSSIIWSNGNIGINMQAIANHSKYYFLEAFDSNYCIGHDSIYLEVKATPSCAIQGAEHVCENESAAYSYIGNGGNNLNYNWHFDGLPNLSGNQNGLVYAQWTQAGNYQIILQVEEFQCFSIPDTLIVQVNPVPILNFTTQSNHHCDSSSVKFISDNPAMASYAWNFGDPLSNADTSSLESPSYIYSVPGNYSVSLLATNQFGCSSSLTIDSLVTVFPKPNASFRVSTKKPDLNNSRVNFFNYSTDYDQLSWDFGEPASGIYNTTDETHPYHIYISEGQFIAKLMLENNYQCFDTAYTIIRIEDGSRLYVPSAFSPDGNGLNDYFLPIFANEEIKEFEMYIFNRWGINTFSTHQYEGWNGNDQNSNESCEPNFYSYVIYIIDSKNVRRKYTGSLTLVR